MVMKRALIFIPVILILIFACKKNHPTGGFVDISGFPLKAGDTWTYQLFDSINNITDTAVFTITSSYSQGSSVYFNTQTIIAGNVTDSGQIINTGDSVIYQPGNGNGLFSTITLLFPMAQGSKWHTRYYGDSVFVIAANLTHSEFRTTYDSVYYVNRIESVPDLYIHQYIYLAPGVGIIEETLEMAPWIPVHKTLRLISYQIH